MAFRGFKVTEEFNQESGGGIVHVPPDTYYLMEGVEVEPSPDDRPERNSEGKEQYAYLLWILKIARGPIGTVGQRLKWGPCTMKEGAQFNNGQIIYLAGIQENTDKLIGLDVNTYAKFQKMAKAITEVFKGKKVTALVADGPPWVSTRGDSYPTSKIVSLYPAEDYEALAGSVVEKAAAPTVKDEIRMPTTKGKKVEPAKEEKDLGPTTDEEIDALFDLAGVKK